MAKTRERTSTDYELIHIYPRESSTTMVKTTSLLLLCATGAAAFAPLGTPSSVAFSRRSAIVASTEVDEEKDQFPEPGRNPDNPDLPEIKGDYDWDAKYSGDPDWQTTDVPGKVVLGDLEIAAQATALGKLEEQWRKERVREEYDGARLLGWTEQAETYNGRFAMFFLVVGLLTEYWTGITIPGQIEEMARVGGFIGPHFSSLASISSTLTRASINSVHEK